MTQLAQLSALVGFFLPILIAFLSHVGWSNAVRSGVAMAVIAVASVITVWADPNYGVTWHNWATSAIAMFLMAKTTYMAVWKPSGIAAVNPGAK